MAALDLVFAPDERAALELVFGDSGGAAGQPQYQLRGAGQLSGLRGALQLHAQHHVVGAGHLSGLRGHIAASWDRNLERPQLAWGRAAAQQASARGAPLRQSAQPSRIVGAGTRAAAQAGTGLAGSQRGRWQASLRLATAARQQAQPGQPLAGDTRAGFQRALSLRAAARARLQLAAPLQQGVRGQFQRTLRLSAGARLHLQPAAALAALAHASMQTGRPLQLAWRPHWQPARHPSPGRSPRPGLPPREPWCYTPALPIELLFAADNRAPLDLLFWCERGGGVVVDPPATVAVLAQRSYIVINSIEIRRADDLAGPPLPSEAFSMTLDRDSWTWSFSATFHRAARDAVAPGPDGSPVELDVKINGQPFRVQAERIGRSVRFPERLVKVSGRGKAALLDAPHAPVQTFSNAAGARTAQQLMLDVLTINGVGMGWGVDFGLTDWQVPAGAFLHQGTWASAVNEIAQAAGGYVQPHDTAATLRILPAWPKPWWEWDTLTPDLELPAGIAEVEETEWIDKPLYDRVFVSGEANGLLGDYKRAGTSGAVLRPMVVHPLITHSDAARQRAVAELSDSGRLMNQQLTLMVLPETGVIRPGTTLRYTDDDGAPRIGIVRSTAINWAFPALTQTIGVEGHA